MPDAGGDTESEGDTASGGDTSAGGDTGGDTAAGGDTGGDTAAGGATFPSELLDLTDWKLTLPIGETDNPVEIEQPGLATYTIDPYFQVGTDGDVVVFQANAGGVTTGGSHFPRSELREMADGGTTKAAWSTTSGVHTMTITQAVTHLPDVVPHLVAGQIHDAKEYVMLVRLDESKLWVKSGGEEVGVLDPDYTLGDEFTLRITAADGWIDVYYNDLTVPAVTLPYETTGCYFKAGAYSQSNTEYGDAPEAYAEVQMRELVVTHE
ncbi:MAG: polysaccharide lyase family 7 protein [Pseudomonadota bacterium]|nr:polysaccharide lyase family 7 protein [Pseudomonadota bacterium]